MPDSSSFQDWGPQMFVPKKWLIGIRSFFFLFLFGFITWKINTVFYVISVICNKLFITLWHLEMLPNSGSFQGYGLKVFPQNKATLGDDFFFPDGIPGFSTNMIFHDINITQKKLFSTP